jgi:RNA-splicing ligase RtcB
MAIKDILRKMFNNNRRIQREGHPKLSPEEVELMTYKERERKDQIRMELARYRLKNNREMILENPFSKMSKEVQGDPQILGAKDVFNTKENIFEKGKSKYKGGGLLW